MERQSRGRSQDPCGSNRYRQAFWSRDPEDVDFAVDPFNELGGGFVACGPRVDKLDGMIVHWSDLVHDQTRKVIFRIWEGILKQDEAIVAVFGHEMYELKRLRPLLMRGKVKIEHFIGMTCPGNPGNFHDMAWDYADNLVMRMRKGRKKS